MGNFDGLAQGTSRCQRQWQQYIVSTSWTDRDAYNFTCIGNDNSLGSCETRTFWLSERDFADAERCLKLLLSTSLYKMTESSVAFGSLAALVVIMHGWIDILCWMLAAVWQIWFWSSTRYFLLVKTNYVCRTNFPCVDFYIYFLLQPKM